MTNPVYSVPLDLVTTAVLTLLRSTGRALHDGAYTGSPTAPAYPYAIVYRIAGGNSDVTPDLAASLRTVTVVYQVTAVSNLRNQCEATTRLFRDRLLARNRDGWVYGLDMPDGWACVDRRPDPAMPGIDRSGDHPQAIYAQPARYSLTLTRA